MTKDILMTQPTSNTALADRHRSEALFHDHKYESGESFPRHYRANPTLPVFERMFALLGNDLSNKRVLEYGCGTGWVTTLLARRGASVAAFDISAEAVTQTRELLAADGLLQQCDVDVMAGEQLDYPDESIDIALGFAILHHLELDAALRELRRVLKPGGIAVFAEPLASNPLIRLYRRLTPQYRTPDEVPIDLDRFRSRLTGFSKFRHEEHMLLATAALACCYIPGLSGAAAPAQRLLMRADDVLLQAMPWAGKWAWYSILVFEK
jgi:SAM-dependent methyltransferase